MEARAFYLNAIPLCSLDARCTEQSYRDSRKQSRARGRGCATTRRAQMHVHAYTCAHAPHNTHSGTHSIRCSANSLRRHLVLVAAHGDHGTGRIVVCRTRQSTRLLVTVRAVGSFQATIRFFPRGKSLLEFAMKNAARRRNGCSHMRT